MEKLAITMSEDTGGASMTFIRWQLPQHWVWFYIGEGGRFAANRLVDSGAVWAASEGWPHKQGGSEERSKIKRKPSDKVEECVQRMQGYCCGMHNILNNLTWGC